MTAREWDGRGYDRVSAPMEALGREVLARLPLRGDETVLDAGCGSGRVTAALVERLPTGRVIAVDASASMVQAARERLGPAVDVRQADLLALRVSPVDAILSTATFHWIDDHRRLYGVLHSALRPGGRLVAQCGGEGNVAAVHRAAQAVAAGAAYAAPLRDWRGPWNFTNPDGAEALLREAGFSDIRCWLQPVRIIPEDPEDYLRTIVLGAHLERLPAVHRDAFVAAVRERLGTPVVIDYVRLNLDAVA